MVAFGLASGDADFKSPAYQRRPISHNFRPCDVARLCDTCSVVLRFSDEAMFQVSVSVCSGEAGWQGGHTVADLANINFYIEP
jgi:hypothetical protein